MSPTCHSGNPGPRRAAIRATSVAVDDRGSHEVLTSGHGDQRPRPRPCDGVAWLPGPSQESGGDSSSGLPHRLLVPTEPALGLGVRSGGEPSVEVRDRCQFDLQRDVAALPRGPRSRRTRGTASQALARSHNKHLQPLRSHGASGRPPSVGRRGTTTGRSDQPLGPEQAPTAAIRATSSATPAKAAVSSRLCTM